MLLFSGRSTTLAAARGVAQGLRVGSLARMDPGGRDEQVDALLRRITEAWFKLTEFGPAWPVEQQALDVRREGRAALQELLVELEDLAPGRFAHDSSQVLTAVLLRLADDQPRALVHLASEAFNTLADRGRA
jgi:hypothetical protein